jgi:hypothetical protein
VGEERRGEESTSSAASVTKGKEDSPGAFRKNLALGHLGFRLGASKTLRINFWAFFFFFCRTGV